MGEIVPLPEGEVTWDTDSVRRKLIEQYELDKARHGELLPTVVKKILVSEFKFISTMPDYELEYNAIRASKVICVAIEKLIDKEEK